MTFSLVRFRNEIPRIQEIEKLRMLRDQVHEKLQRLPLANPVHPDLWNMEINALHDDIIRFAAAEAERQLRGEGAGPPPLPYAMLLFGSGGRGEQTLWSDQDNGFVYADPEPGKEEAANDYFAALSDRVVLLLERLGYPRCEGEVLCSNPKWRLPVSGWRATMRTWMEEPNWENMRYLLITADSRAIFGSGALVHELRCFLLEAVRENQTILWAMLQNTLKRKVSLGVLGNLIPERYGEDMGGIDIKYGAYIPIVNAIRLLAVRSGITETSTAVRIRLLQRNGQVGEKLAAEWMNAFLTVLSLRLLTANRIENGCYHTSGILPGSLLGKERKRELKTALRAGQSLHKYVEREINR